MERIEYIQKLKDAQKECDNKIDSIHKEFALSNAKFKIGDTIKDERWAFTVDKITTYVSFGDSCPVYHGFELKKDLTRKKNNNRVTIYGNKAQLLTPTK